MTYEEIEKYINIRKPILSRWKRANGWRKIVFSILQNFTKEDIERAIGNFLIWIDESEIEGYFAKKRIDAVSIKKMATDLEKRREVFAITDDDGNEYLLIAQDGKIVFDTLLEN